MPAGCIKSAKFLVSAYLNFFDETPTEILSRRGAYNTGLQDQDQTGLQPNPMERRETLEPVRYYYRITDPAVRKNVFEMAKILALSKSS